MDHHKSPARQLAGPANFVTVQDSLSQVIDKNIYPKVLTVRDSCYDSAGFPKGSSVAFKRKVPSPAVSDQNTLVRQCLERILQSHIFASAAGRNSSCASWWIKKRDGHEDEIKERTIGIELFGRIADFETSGDSIVRVNATDVRRRLGQYYQEARDPDPVQIVLPPALTFQSSSSRKLRRLWCPPLARPVPSR